LQVDDSQPGTMRTLAGVARSPAWLAVIRVATKSRMERSSSIMQGLAIGMVRLSVGLEAADDIVADLAQALRASQRI